MAGENSAMPPEAYRNIAAGIIGIAREVTDTGFQERVWLRAEEPGVQSSYEDIMGSLFDDYDVGRVVENPSEYGFSEDEAKKLRNFVMKLAIFADQHAGATSANVVGSPDWLTVQRAASDFVGIAERHHYG